MLSFFCVYEDDVLVEERVHIEKHFGQIKEAVEGVAEKGDLGFEE